MTDSENKDKNQETIDKEGVLSVLKNTILDSYKIGGMPLTFLSIGVILIIAPFILISLETVKPYFLYFIISGIVFLVIAFSIYLIQIYWRKNIIVNSLNNYYITIQMIIDKYLGVKRDYLNPDELAKLISAISKLSKVFIGKKVIDFKQIVPIGSKGDDISNTSLTVDEQKQAKQDPLGLIEK